MADKELNKLLKTLRKQDWTIEYAGRHIKARSPTNELVTISSTCSDKRAFLNIRADLRRAGADV